MRKLGGWLVLTASLGLAAAAGAATADVKEVHKTVDLNPDGRVAIDTYKGWIEVATWDRREVEVSARIEPDDSDNDRDQAEKVKETEVRIEGSGSSVSIKSDYERVRWHGFWRAFGIDGGTLPFVRYAIRMPRTARLTIKDYKSSMRIADLAADLNVNTYKGRVEASGMNGAVRLKTYKGDVRVDFARFARSDFKTYRGEIEIGIPRQSGFDLDASVGRRGSLSSDFELASRSASGRWDREPQHRRGAVNGGGALLSLETYKGSFRIRRQ